MNGSSISVIYCSTNCENLNSFSRFHTFLRKELTMNKSIAVAGTGYVGLSISVLLAQHNHVVAVDIIPEKIALINQKKSPIQDEYIEKYLSEKELDLTATSDGESAYADADFVVVATPTNYDLSLIHI